MGREVSSLVWQRQISVKAAVEDVVERIPALGRTLDLIRPKILHPAFLTLGGRDISEPYRTQHPAHWKSPLDTRVKVRCSWRRGTQTMDILAASPESNRSIST